MIPWSNGKPLVWDFTCVHRLSPSYINNAVNEGPFIANNAEVLKTRKYDELSFSHIVQPVAVETLGGIGSESLNFLKELGKKISVATDQKRAPEFLRQRLGIAVQVGNAAAVCETFTSRAEPWTLISCFD